MNARAPADGPPRNGNAPDSAESRGADRTETFRHNDTPTTRDAQQSAGAAGLAHFAALYGAAPESPHVALRWQVCTTKTSGASVKFGDYATKAEALAVASRLREVGGNATVVEVLP